MNNTSFKLFVAPYLASSIEYFGGIEQVHEWQAQGVGMTAFIAGVVIGMIAAERIAVAATWREGGMGSIGKLTHEEVRRVFDLVRLRLEAESTTS